MLLAALGGYAALERVQLGLVVLMVFRVNLGSRLCLLLRVPGLLPSGCVQQAL
jgi:hypothetical protein